MTGEGNYFAYGSNLLSSRMHVHNKDATKFSIGRLNNWKLVFSGFSASWGGATANIVKSPGDEVIGVIWSVVSFDPLDAQEAGYEPVEVQVEDLKTGQVINCRSYIQLKSFTDLEGGNGQPSRAYKNVILAGARESNLPIEYYTKLNQLEDNSIIPDHIVKMVPEAAN